MRLGAGVEAGQHRMNVGIEKAAPAVTVR